MKKYAFLLLLVLVICACTRRRTVMPPTPIPEPKLLIAPRPTEKISIEEEHERIWREIYATARAEANIKTATAEIITATAEATIWAGVHTPQNIYSPTPAPKKACNVKGSKNLIYHCKNSPNFYTMKEYTCFNTEAEAIAAGYRMTNNRGGWCLY